MRHIKQRYQKILVPSLLVVLLIIGSALVASFLYISRDRNPIPETIKTQLVFSPFIIASDSTTYTTFDYTYTRTENSTRVLSYKTRIDEIDIIISQYPQPAEFSDITEYKDRFLSNIIHQYDSVQTSNGTFYLGRQTLQNNKQIGVLIERGLLVLMSPSKDIDKEQWRKLVDQLEIQKID